MSLSLGWNACTNYLGMVTQLLQGILVTRLLVSHLGAEQYGLWSIIWSFFMYSLLLDFGLGAAAQKATANELYRKDIGKYNRTIASVVGINLSMTVVIVLMTLVGCWCIRGLLHLPPEAELGHYRRCLLLCGLGSAVTFPLGVFSEIVVGLHRMYVRNYVMIAGRVVEMLGIWAIVSAGGGVQSLLLFTLGCTAARSLALMVYVRRTIPGFRLGIWPDRESLRGISQFSAAVYVMSLTRLAWVRGASLMLSMSSGLTAVGAYQLGNKLPGMLDMAIQPSQEMFAPLAARLHGNGKTRWAGRMLLKAMQLNAYLCHGLSLGMLVYSRPLIRLLLGVDRPDVTLIAQLTVLSIWFRLVLRSLSDKYLLMTGHHRRLAQAQLWECGLYLSLGIGLVWLVPEQAGAMVLMAMLAARVAVTCGLLFPCLGRSLEMPWWLVLWRSALRPLVVALPLAALAVAEYVLLLGRIHDFWLLALAGTSGGLTYAACVWCLGLGELDRRLWLSWLRRRLRRLRR